MDSISDTSVLVRVPVAKKPETDARNGPAPSLFLSGGRNLLFGEAFSRS